MTKRQRGFALLGGLLGAVYLTVNRLLPGVPELLLGAVLGLGLVCMVMALLPEKTGKKVRKWKRRGE